MVVAELVAPWLMSVRNPVDLLITGALLMALPSLIIAVPTSSAVLIICAVAIRGLGMGITVVVSVAKTMELSAPNRRGRTIGYVGLASGLPGIVCPPIGVALADAKLAPVAVLLSCGAGVLGAGVAALLPREARRGTDLRLNPLSALRRPGLITVAIALVLASCTYGGILTYVPIVLSGSGPTSAAMFFLVMGITRAVGRWGSGIFADSYSIRAILVAGLALAGGGLIAIANGSPPFATVVGAIAYGVGSGAVQSGAYLTMAQRTVSSERNAVSALWNAAIDVGSATGGGIMGVSAAIYGFRAAFWLWPLIIAAALPFIYVARQGGHPADSMALSNRKPATPNDPS